LQDSGSTPLKSTCVIMRCGIFRKKIFKLNFLNGSNINFHKTAVFELKLARGNSLPFSAVQEHQINALLNAKHAHIIHKIPDVGYQNPFDCFMIKGSEAYVGVMYNREKEFFLIDVDVFLKEKEESERKSLTKERAAAIGEMMYLAKT